MNQQTLFADTTNAPRRPERGGESISPPRSTRGRHGGSTGFLRNVPEPYGEPDRSGRHWYERFGEDIAKLPAMERDVLLSILLDWPQDRVDEVRRLLDRWARAHPAETDNFHEAMGR